MKKGVICCIFLVVLACVCDDENVIISDQSYIRFNLNGVDHYITEYSVMLNPADTNERIVEASFDNNSKTLYFSVEVEETNQIDILIFIENSIQYSSDPIYGERETSITTHTDSKMEGIFRVTFEDSLGRPKFTFTKGVINIEY